MNITLMITLLIYIYFYIYECTGIDIDKYIYRERAYCCISTGSIRDVLLGLLGLPIELFTDILLGLLGLFGGLFTDTLLGLFGGLLGL